MRKLNFSEQINSVGDLCKFTRIYQHLREDYNIESMDTTLLVFDIIERIRKGDLTQYKLLWEDYDHE